MLQAELPPEGAGGVGHQVDLLATTMSRRGHDVTVFTTTDVPAERPYQSIRVRLRSHGRLSRQTGVGRSFASLDLGGFDVVHAHGDDWALGRTPRVRTFYGSALMEARTATSWLRRGSQLAHYGFEWISSMTAEGVVISRHTRRFLPLAKHHIPCGFDPSAFFPGGRRTAWPSLLFVAGRLGGRKRGELLLEAFTEVRLALPDATLTVVSHDIVTGPGVTSFADLDRPTLGDVYRRHWALCSTSSYEGFGLPYVEAMASGLPVVATSNSGALEVLDRGRLGVICTPDQLVSTLIRFLGEAGRRAQLASVALQAVQRYSIDVVAAEYERTYETLCVRRRSPHPKG